MCIDYIIEGITDNSVILMGHVDI